MFLYYGKLLQNDSKVLGGYLDFNIFRDVRPWLSRRGLRVVKDTSFICLDYLPSLVRKTEAIPNVRDDQYVSSYYMDNCEDNHSENVRSYFNSSVGEFSYHHLPTLQESDMSNNIISANFGADLLLSFQQKALEDKLTLETIDDIDLLESDYEKLTQTLKELGTFSITHRFSLLTTITEFIIKDKLMVVLAKRFRNQESNYEYAIERGIMLPEYSEIFSPYFKELPKQPKVSWVTSIRDERPNITTLPIKAPGMYNPLAYPSIGESLDDFVKGYVESSSNILLMYSPPGTGKTTLLKHLLEATRESCLITYSEEIKNMDSLFAYFLTSNEKFLIIEDADNYLTARDKDANNHSMKKLLNITDGLTSNPDKKVIFTTNLPTLNQVDSALLRPGRCYKALYFPYLTYDQASAFLMSETNGELPALFANKTFKPSAEFSLASLHSYLNGYDPDLIVESGHKSSFGFKN